MPGEGGRDARKVALAAFLAAWAVALVVRGRLHADEVFQVLEPAHHLAFGGWVQEWEWREGLRSWAVPGVLAGLLAGAARLGLEHPWGRAALVWACCAAVQAAGAVWLYRLVRERDGVGPARLAAAVLVTWGGWLVYAARPLGDALSVAPLVGAVLFTRRARGEGRAGPAALAGLLVGAAFAARYPSAVFGVPLAVSLVLGRRWRALVALAAGFAGVFLALGVLDALTWGAPWHSFRTYLGFNALSGEAARIFGTRPAWWSLLALASTAPMLLAWHFTRGLARRDLPVGVFLAYLAVVTATPHKEMRFLLPALPLFVAVAAAPAWRTLQGLGARARLGLAGVYAVSSLAAGTVQLPMGTQRDVTDAWVAAGRDPTLTGLVFAGLPSWQGSGMFHLGREVPLLATVHAPPPLSDPAYSHVLAVGPIVTPADAAAAGLCRVGVWGRAVLWRRCALGPP